MKANQTYFPLLDSAGKLTNKFLIVSNIRPADPSDVIGGNERVVRPRLADAKFFFDQDRKKKLEDRVAGLDKVIYHNKLGTQGQRVKRVRTIARWVASQIGTDPDLADRAALLAKADLLTDMVGEFPELQGVMGGYYAKHDGEHPFVAAAISSQYVVRRDEQEDADNLVGEALLLSDRVETLVGIWAIGLKPTGDKDPFALRRHALGVIKSFELCGATASILGEELKLKLAELLRVAADTFETSLVNQEVLNEISLFIFERYSNQLAPLFGIRSVDAVISLKPPLHEVVKRIMAVRKFEELPESVSLAAANKRVGNILKKVEGVIPNEIDENLLNETAEVALKWTLGDVRQRADIAFEAGDYAASLKALAALRAPVDAFFNDVMVNVEDVKLRNNRLALLANLHEAMNRVADLSKLST
jgi:glycyl-tRNA synthetase beta chain